MGFLGTANHYGRHPRFTARPAGLRFRQGSLSAGGRNGGCDGAGTRIIAIFMEGLTPLSEAAHEFMQKRFPGREFYIGLDSAILIGHPITIAAGIVLIPITLILAVILPGNQVLPAADLAATAFFVAMVPPMTKGNLFRSIVFGTVIMAMVLYIATAFAPLLTQTAVNIGFEMPEGER